jgi:choline transport protein
MIVNSKDNPLYFKVRTPVDLESFNWCVVMFVGTLVLALVSYYFQGRHVYVGPVVRVVGRGEER